MRLRDGVDAFEESTGGDSDFSLESYPPIFNLASIDPNAGDSIDGDTSSNLDSSMDHCKNHNPDVGTVGNALSRDLATYPRDMSAGSAEMDLTFTVGAIHDFGEHSLSSIFSY